MLSQTRLLYFGSPGTNNKFTFFECISVEASQLSCQLFTKLEIERKMWPAIKDLYTGVKHKSYILDHFLYHLIYFREKGREEYLLHSCIESTLTVCCMFYTITNYAIFIRSLQLTSPSFADDITLLALHPSFLNVFMDMCHQYSIKWRYEFNHTKWGVVTFGESKALHFQCMNEWEWKLGNDIVDDVYEYKNLGILKKL